MGDCERIGKPELNLHKKVQARFSPKEQGYSENGADHHRLELSSEELVPPADRTEPNQNRRGSDGKKEEICQPYRPPSHASFLPEVLDDGEGNARRALPDKRDGEDIGEFGDHYVDIIHCRFL